MAERFRIADLEIFAIGDGQCWVRPAEGGPPVTLPEPQARLLASCAEYRTLEEHAQSWTRRAEERKIAGAKQQAPRWLARALDPLSKPAEPSARATEATKDQLTSLVRMGLLRSLPSLFSDLLAHSLEEPSGPIAALGFTTRRRVPELRRALDSYAANFQRHGRSPEILVVDDSRDAGAEAETEAMLRDFQRESGLPVRFAGLAEREAYAEAIAHEGRVNPGTARFALLGDERCGVTTGSARNCLLLDSASTRYVLADDDGLCRMARPPEAQDGLDLVSQNDPTQFWFYESRDALHRSLSFTDEVDLFGLHEELLGRPVELVGAGKDLDLAISPAFDSRLRHFGGVVRTTMAGVVGDSGVASTAYLHIEPKSRARLTESESFYQAAVASRQVLRAPQRVTISEGFLTMAGNLGIDAASLFPPFPPVQRNSDGIAGRLLQGCFPSSCRGYLNWAALHDPVETRAQSVDAWFADMRNIRFADVLSVFLRDLTADRAVTPDEALGAAGERLARLGRIPVETFAQDLRGRLLGRDASRLAQLHSAAQEEVPAFYRALRERYAAVLREAAPCEDYIRPRDLPGDALELAQNLVGKIGYLLMAWPRLWNGAIWMRTNGRRLTRPVA
jgi:hypothetical protein